MMALGALLLLLGLGLLALADFFFDITPGATPDEIRKFYDDNKNC